jgi:O-antigen/teichoic acid export membrane protein
MTDRDSQRVADDAGALLLGRALAILAEAGLLIVVVRLLGKADVGVLAEMLLVCQTIAIVATAGLPASLLIELPGASPSVRHTAARQHVRVLAVLGVVSGCGLALSGIASSDPWVWLCLAPFPFFDLPVRALPNLLVIEGRAASGARYAVLKSVIGSVATIVPIAVGAPLWVVAACVTVGAAAAWLAVPLLLADIYRDVPRAPLVRSDLALVRRALPLGVTDIAGAIAQRLDRLLVVAYFSAESFAEYQVGAWQIPLVVNIPYAVGTASAAPMREAFASGRGAAAVALWRSSIRQVSLVVVPISMVFFVAADPVVELLFTTDYADAAPVFRCYTLLTMMRVAAFGAVLVAADRGNDVLLSASFGLVVAAMLGWPSVLLGPLGPAIAAVVAFVPAAAFYCLRIAKAADLSLWRTFPLAAYCRIVACAAVPGVLAAWWIDDASHGAVVELAVATVVVLGGFVALASLTRDLGVAQWRFLLGWLRLAPLRRS